MSEANPIKPGHVQSYSDIGGYECLPECFCNKVGEDQVKTTLGIVVSQEITYPEDEDLPGWGYKNDLHSLFKELPSQEEAKRIFDLICTLVEKELGSTGEDDRIRACIR